MIINACVCEIEDEADDFEKCAKVQEKIIKYNKVFAHK